MAKIIPQDKVVHITNLYSWYWKYNSKVFVKN